MYGDAMPTAAPAAVGDLLREWRQRRHLSQLDLACDTEISTRHLSFIETGRSTPSREMVLKLAERLEVPLRARNTLLTAAGYAPIYAERPLGDPALAPARQAIDRLLTAHEPYPAIAIDRHWTLVASNRVAARLMGGVDPALLQPHANVLRLSLHPGGLATRIANLVEWRTHLLARLRRQVDVSADPVLGELLRELAAYPPPDGVAWSAAAVTHDYGSVLVPLQLRTGDDILSFFSTTTIFGTPVDVTLSEIALESFFPADAATGELLRRAAESE
jgi:transcriptional regulator with XRE-family HTH domain